MKSIKENKKRIAAADAFIIILLLLSIAAVGVRITFGSRGLLSANERGEFLVSYVVSGIKSEYSDAFSAGREFYLENGEKFGVLRDGAVFTPAKTYTENYDGICRAVYASDGTVDVKGTATVSGTMTDSGFLLGGSRYIAANLPLTISSSDITVTITVTDITTVQ